MNMPTPEEADQLKADIEAELRNVPLLWEERLLKLYFVDGFYVVRSIITPTLSDYLGVSPDGELKDLVGYPVTSDDYRKVVDALRGGGQHDVEAKVIARYRNHRW